jgi:TolA-binding protein
MTHQGEDDMKIPNISRSISIFMFLLVNMTSIASSADLLPQNYSQTSDTRTQLQLQAKEISHQPINYSADIQQQLNSMSDKEKNLFRSLNEMQQHNNNQRSNATHRQSNRQKKGKGRGKGHGYGTGYEARHGGSHDMRGKRF